MESSTNTLIFTATYVIIFLIATTLSIVLYFNVNRYADIAFNYSKNMDSSVINSEITNDKERANHRKYLNQDEVFSYYVNYVKKDLYDTKVNNDVNYNVSIIDPSAEASFLGENLSYSEVKSKLNGYNEYYLEYVEEQISGNKKNVKITIGPVRESE